MEFVTKTVEEVYNALAKNGFEHIRGAWIEYLDNKIGACILGQGALNLNVLPFNPIKEADSEEGVFEKVFDELYDEDYGHHKDAIKQFTIYDQLNKYSVPETSKWYKPYSAEKVGTAITYWNDKDTGSYDPNTLEAQFELKTYQEVLDMAYDLMKPHFKRKLTLAVHHYEMPTVGAF